MGSMNLNYVQRRIMIVGFIIFVLMGIFPPWISTYHVFSPPREKPEGYGFIFSPPEPEDPSAAWSRLYGGIKIDIYRLFAQWLVLCAVTGLGIYVGKIRIAVAKEYVKRNDLFNKIVLLIIIIILILLVGLMMVVLLYK